MDSAGTDVLSLAGGLGVSGSSITTGENDPANPLIVFHLTLPRVPREDIVESASENAERDEILSIDDRFNNADHRDDVLNPQSIGF